MEYVSSLQTTTYDFTGKTSIHTCAMITTTLLIGIAIAIHATIASPSEQAHCIPHHCYPDADRMNLHPPSVPCFAAVYNARADADAYALSHDHDISSMIHMWLQDSHCPSITCEIGVKQLLNEYGDMINQVPRRHTKRDEYERLTKAATCERVRICEERATCDAEQTHPLVIA